MSKKELELDETCLGSFDFHKKKKKTENEVSYVHSTRRDAKVPATPNR